MSIFSDNEKLEGAVQYRGFMDWMYEFNENNQADTVVKTHNIAHFQGLRKDTWPLQCQEFAQYTLRDLKYNSKFAPIPECARFEDCMVWSGVITNSDVVPTTTKECYVRVMGSLENFHKRSGSFLLLGDLKGCKNVALDFINLPSPSAPQPRVGLNLETASIGLDDLSEFTLTTRSTHPINLIVNAMYTTLGFELASITQIAHYWPTCKDWIEERYYKLKSLELTKFLPKNSNITFIFGAGTDKSKLTIDTDNKITFGSLQYEYI